MTEERQITDQKLSNYQITQDKLTQFSKFVETGIESWKKAGEIIVSIVDSGEMSVDDIAQRIPHVNKRTISQFEKIGRKQIMPEILIASYPASKPISKLPYSEQKRAITEMIEVATDDGDHRLIPVEDLTSSQTQQVFSGSTIRSVASQMAWRQSQKSKAAQAEIVETPMPYTVKGKTVVFVKGAKLQASEIATLLANMTK